MLDIAAGQLGSGQIGVLGTFWHYTLCDRTDWNRYDTPCPEFIST